MYQVPDFKLGTGTISIGPVATPGILALAVFLFAVYAFSSGKGPKTGNLPFLNPPIPFDFGNRRRIKEYTENSLQLMQKGRQLYPNQPYAMYTELGDETIVLPTHMVNEVKRHPALGFSEGAEEQTHAYIPGFKPFQSTGMAAVINRFMTKTLSRVTEPLSKEATLAWNEMMPDCTDWTEIHMAPISQMVVARLATLAFAGEGLARDMEWNRVMNEYTILAFGYLNQKLHESPRAVRPLIHWFMPDCWKARSLLKQLHAILAPYIAQREALIASGATPPDDALEWVKHVSNPESWDPVTFQVALALNAIHTTTDLLSTAMFRIAQHPEIIQPLREEVIRSFTEHGLTKGALGDMKLADSVLKESSRLKPVLLAGFRRWAVKDFTLSTGLTIRRGQAITADTLHMMNGFGEAYENPLEFDPYRFLKMRSTPGKESQALLVTTSENHLGFGHGDHACPGRFFASNEVKIILAHLLLKYDWKLAPGSENPKTSFHGLFIVGDHTTKYLFKRRQPEIDLDNLA